MMKDLQVQDKVYIGNKGNQPQYQQVYAFGHLDASSPTEYLIIHTAQSGSNPLEISPAHLLYVNGKTDPVRADAIQPGDILSHKPVDAPAKAVAVTKVDRIIRKGAYMPLTKDGSIVVNGIHASTYVSILENAPGIVTKFQSFLSEHDLLHWWLAPYRMVCTGVSSNLCQNDYNQDGIAYWLAAGKYIAQVGDGWGLVFQLVGVAAFTLSMAAGVAFEALFGSCWGLLLLGLLIVTKSQMKVFGKGATKKKVE
jgi:hypothetical protein